MVKVLQSRYLKEWNVTLKQNENTFFQLFQSVLFSSSKTYSWLFLNFLIILLTISLIYISVSFVTQNSFSLYKLVFCCLYFLNNFNHIYVWFEFWFVIQIQIICIDIRLKCLDFSVKILSCIKAKRGRNKNV